MRAEVVEEPLLSAVCPWCGSAEPPFAGGFCPACHQSRQAVDRSAYCELHGDRGDPATLVIAPPAPTLVAEGRSCPACGYAFAAAPAVVPASVRPRRRRRRARSLEVALGVVTAVGIVLFGAERTGDTVTTPPAAAATGHAAVTPRAAISRHYGYDVGPCLLVYRTDAGDTYVCAGGDVARIAPDGSVQTPSLSF